MKLYTKTFGCQMNFADSDEMSRHFFSRGFTRADTEENAQGILINTCTVRELAEHKAMSYMGSLREWKQNGSERMIIVTGCAAERAKNEIRRKFPHVDLIVGAKDIESFPKKLDEFLSRRPGGGGSPGFKPDIQGKDYNLVSGPPQEELVPADFRRNDEGVVQFVTIMRGCNYSCSYCIVPSVRGRERYLPPEEIRQNVADRVAGGAKEIWLLGQTVNSYRPGAGAPSPAYDFADLLRDLDETPGLERLRFTSPHPFYLTDKLIDAMADCRTVCEHLHLPVQSGSDAMLRKMKRTYSRESYLEGIRKLKTRISDLSLTTDFIVGFPGETDADFEATLRLVDDADFDAAYCFKYSPRPGTESAAWEDDVPATVKTERVNVLLDLIEARGRRKAESLVGTRQEVLVEEITKDGSPRGKTRTHWKLRLPPGSGAVGDLVAVKVDGTYLRELRGKGEIQNPKFNIQMNP